MNSQQHGKQTAQLMSVWDDGGKRSGRKVPDEVLKNVHDPIVDLGDLIDRYRRAEACRAGGRVTDQ